MRQGSTCPASGAGNITASVDLLAGGTATFTVPAMISSAASSTVTNTVTVSAPAGTIDPTPANNSAADTDTVTPAATPTAELSVTKTNGVTVVSAGATTTYTVVVSNAGPDAANSAIVTDPAAAGTDEDHRRLCESAGGATCPASPTVAQVEAGLAIPGAAVRRQRQARDRRDGHGRRRQRHERRDGDRAGGRDRSDARKQQRGRHRQCGHDGGSQPDGDQRHATGSRLGDQRRYTIVVANVGASAAAGRGRRWSANAVGLRADSPSPAPPAAGAACPGGPTVAQFGTGLSVPTPPPGGSADVHARRDRDGCRAAP